MACPGGEFPIFKFDIYSGRRGYLTFTRKQYDKTEIGFRKLSENPTLEMTQGRFGPVQNFSKTVDWPICF